MTSNSIFNALADIVSSVKRYPLVGMLGWADIKQRYRRSRLGAFWLTVSMGVMIASIGLVFGQIFNTPMQNTAISRFGDRPLGVHFVQRD